MSQELSQDILPVPEISYNDIHFYGIKRSGNHAIIAWILGHFEEYIYYNNCIVVPGAIFYRVFEGIVFTEKLQNPRSLLSFEDNIFSGNTSNLYSLGKYLPKAKIKVLILRDPLNNYASRIKKAEELNWWNIEGFLNTEIWKDTAKEFLGITNHLKADVKINYNSWFKDVNYRKQLSLNYFGEFSDKNINHVPLLGNGSSFDSRNYDGKAGEMKVLDRWQEMKKSSILNYLINQVIKDEELMELSNAIFGNLYDNSHF